MKKIRIVSVKTQSILILIYMAIAAIITNLLAGKAVYELIDPQEDWAKGLAVMAGLCVFLLLCAFIGGVFVKKELADIEKKLDHEEHH